MPASDQQTTELGYALPKGTDSPRQGDDVIRQNAKASAGYLIDLLGRSLVGSGSPVGVAVPARRGITYTDTNATAGARQWISTGTTSADWTVLSGDTGARDISASVDPAWTSAKMNIRRVGANIVVNFNGKSETSSGVVPMLAIPSGFAPTLQVAWTSGALYYSSKAGGATLLVVPSTGVLTAYNVTASGSFFYGAITYATADAWPAVLPGTPA